MPQYYDLGSAEGAGADTVTGNGVPVGTGAAGAGGDADFETPQFVTPQYNNPVFYDGSTPVFTPSAASTSPSFSLDEGTLKDYVKKQM